MNALTFALVSKTGFRKAFARGFLRRFDVYAGSTFSFTTSSVPPKVKYITASSWDLRFKESKLKQFGTCVLVGSQTRLLYILKISSICSMAVALPFCPLIAYMTYIDPVTNQFWIFGTLALSAYMILLPGAILRCFRNYVTRIHYDERQGLFTVIRQGLLGEIGVQCTPAEIKAPARAPARKAININGRDYFMFWNEFNDYDVYKIFRGIKSDRDIVLEKGKYK